MMSICLIINLQVCNQYKLFMCNCFCRCTLKCDAIDNSLCEAFNGTICKAKRKPLLLMLEDIRKYLMKRMFKKLALMSDSNEVLCSRVRKKLEKLKVKASKCHCKPATSNKFQVSNGDDVYSVDINARSCSCNAWDLIGSPCKYAITSIGYMREDPEYYVDDVFKK